MLDDYTIDTEVEEKEQLRKVKKYEEAVKDYPLFTAEEALSEISDIESLKQTPGRVLFR